MDKLEQIAIEIHDGWMDYQRQSGRRFGQHRTRETHPHIIAWPELDLESQNQDRFIASVVLQKWAANSLRLDELPQLIHDAWCTWASIHSEGHAHAQPYQRVHGQDAAEHLEQSRRLANILELNGT